MRAHVLLNLLNKLRKSDKMQVLLNTLSGFYHSEFINSIKQEQEY